MKSKNKSKKLSLNKKTVALLTESEMNDAKGGFTTMGDCTTNFCWTSKGAYVCGSITDASMNCGCFA